MANRIPRTAKRLEVTTLTDTVIRKAGETFIATKDAFGWITECNGKTYRLFIQHLRNEKYNKVKILN